MKTDKNIILVNTLSEEPGKQSGKKKKKDANVTSNYKKLMHELQVHQIELEMQNEELLRIRDELESAINKYDDFYNFAPVGYISLDYQGTILEINLKGATMLGLDRANIINKRLQLFLFNESLPVFSCLLKEVFGKNVNAACQLSINRTSDTPIIVQVECSPPIGNRKCLAVLTDITEIKKYEAALTESQRNLNLALDSGNIGIWEWDLRTDELFLDLRMENIFGLAPGTFDKSYSAFEKFIVDEDLVHFRESLKKSLEERIPFDTIYRIRLHENEIKYLATKALINYDKNADPVKMTGVCFDITEMEKSAEQTLFKLNEELLRSNKELEQFAYVASHDLQEPLRMVSSFTQLLAKRYENKLDNDAKEFIHFAVGGAMHMQIMINDLLAYSRINKKGKAFTHVNMEVVMEHVMYTSKLSIKERNARITWDKLPSVYADEGQMIHLLQNLVGNAIKFCRKNPKIHISCKEVNNSYVFSVKDNGLGIEPEYFDKIFQIFQRLQSKEEYPGTGIGLAICRRIVERHGGKIWLESEINAGSTFYFTLMKTQKTKL